MADTRSVNFRFNFYRDLKALNACIQSSGSGGNISSWQCLQNSERSAGIECPYICVNSIGGTVLWAKTFGTDSTDFGIKATEGPNGYLISGSTKGVTGAQSGTTDVLLVYVDPNGNEQWTKTVGDLSSNDFAFETVTAPGIGFALAGYTASNSFGGDEGCVWIVDSTGNVQATFLTGGSQHDEIRAAVMGQSTLFLAGNTYSYGLGQAADYWVTKWDLSNGPPVIKWTKTYGGNQNESLQSAQMLPDGNILLMGLSNSYGSGGDGLIVMIDSAIGSPLIAKSYGASGMDVIMSVAFANQGALFLGQTNSSGGAQTNILLVAPDQTGGTPCNSATATLTPVIQPDTSVFNNVTSDAVTLNIATQTLTSPANTATLTDVCAGTDVTEVTTQFELGLFPNPVLDRCELVFFSNNNSNARVSICNYLGQEVKVLNEGILSGKNSISLDLNDLSKGMYFVKVSTAQGQSTKVFTIQ